MNSNVISDTHDKREVGLKMYSVRRTKTIVREIRYALCGAIVGVAIVGILGRHLGIDEGNVKDIVGAVIGFGTVLAVQLLHI